MVKIDLVTGFLGSGKTTFIRRYAQYLLSRGERVCILENDYGAINVDMMLLSDLQSDRLGIEMVAGGCDYDCHRRRFRTKLITMAMLGYTRVIVEPSGIFDVDEFFDILHESPLDERYEIANVLTIVKADLESDFSEEADYMLASQIAEAGCVVLSHVQETSQAVMDETIRHINRALETIHCRRQFSLGHGILAKDWKDLTDEDFAAIASSGYYETAFEKKYSMDETSFVSLFFMNVSLSASEVIDRIPKVFRDPAAGHVIRVKGFLEKEDGSWIEVNATEKGLQFNPIRAGQKILIVIGERLDEHYIDTYFPAEFSTTHRGLEMF